MTAPVRYRDDVETEPNGEAAIIRCAMIDPDTEPRACWRALVTR